MGTERPILKSRDPPGSTGVKSDVVGAGAPTGASRLSHYSLVLGTVVVTVLIVTLSSMKFLGDSFGGWESNAGSTSTIRLRVGENKNHHNFGKGTIEQETLQTYKKITVPASQNDLLWADNDFPDSEDEAKPEETSEEPKVVSSEEVTTAVEKDEGKNKNKDNANDENKNKNEDNDNDKEKDEKKNEENDKDKDAGKDEKKKKKKKKKKKTDEDKRKDENKKKDKDKDTDNDEKKKDKNIDTGNDENNNNKKNESTGKDMEPSLLESVLNARDTMIQKLRKDYGDKYFESIFVQSVESKDDLIPEKHRMDYLPIRPLAPKDRHYSKHFGSDELKEYQRKNDPKYYNSVSNLQRKMMIKILTAKQDPSVNKYVWATGGHSAAAGHGNYFSESYTKVMEATSSKVFEAAGLDFEARNYAMGATSSAAEMSMCFPEIYGNDVDIFSWDFGMLESRDYLNVRFLHYGSRGLLSNQQIIPALVGLQSFREPRLDMMTELNDAFRGDDNEPVENNGLALFLNDESYWKKMKDAIPDTFGLGVDEISQIPEFIRHFKCDGAIEKGEPFCDDKKYTMEVCPDRMGMASWHPGWKYHALVGNSMALFLVEMLVGAVQKIERSVNPDDWTLSKLLKEEGAFRDQMIRAQTAQLPTSFQKTYWYNNTSDDNKFYSEAEAIGLETGSDEFKANWNAFDRKALFHGPSICHTARLPAQTRFLGHLTNQPELTGKQAIFGEETYYTGIEDKDYYAMTMTNIKKDDKKPHDMQLVWVEDKERQKGCGDILAKPDYHDFFMAMEAEGWTSVIFPNEAEQTAYGYHEHKDDYKGMLIIVPRICAFDRCEKGFLGHTEYNSGKWTIRVNGITVTALTMIGHEAILLEHEDGIIFDPNKDGKYHLELKVNEPNSFIKISAFVLY